jgi:hypothetical protein
MLEEEKQALVGELREEIRKEMLATRGQGGTTKPPTQMRAHPPSLFSGKRGSLLFFDNILEAFAILTHVPEKKWVALSVQLLNERPTQVWDAFVRKQARVMEGTKLPWEDL